MHLQKSDSITILVTIISGNGEHQIQYQPINSDVSLLEVIYFFTVCTKTGIKGIFVYLLGEGLPEQTDIQMI